ncbi:MAG: glycosyltransferase family 39 protein [Bacteroidota bacterium]
MRTASRSAYIIAAFALIKFLVPFILIHPQFELHRDEYLYLADADHMAWGYIEMPPMLATLGYLSKLAGGTVYTVYFWGGLFGALTMIVVGKMVLQLKGNAIAVFFACLAFLCAGFLRMHILFQPNFLDVFFWTWASYLIICQIDTGHKKYLYWLGICFGLGILGKYSTAFYIISFAVAVLLTDKRKWLLNPHFYFAMLLGVLVCLPNLLWQIIHHFPLMHHMDLLTKQQLQYNSRKDFIIDQLLLSLPSFFIWIGGLWFILMKRQGRKYMVIAFIYLGIVGLLLYFNGKGYYAAAIYPTLMAFGGVWLAQVTEQRKWKWLQVAAPLATLFLTWRILPMLLPYQSPQNLSNYYRSHAVSKPALIWEDHKQHALPQDFADMLGWKEMAEKTAKVYNSLPDSVKKQTMVYGDNYGEAGALSFYGKKLGLPEIFSDNASYVFWLPDQFTQKYFLFVTAELPDAGDSFFNHWQKREILDSVTQPLAREYRAKIILYSQPDDSVRVIAESKILEGKQKFKLR